MGYEKGSIKCLLLRVADQLALPGGFIKRNESVEDASTRILSERIGMSRTHSNFLAVFGHEDRQFQAQWRKLLADMQLPWEDDYWINERFVTLAHYALVNMADSEVRPGEFVDEIAWIDFNELPRMWVDHRSIALAARERLKEDVKKDQISYKLLPEPFTMPELHRLHQAILEKKLDRSRFQKNMLSTGRFERLQQIVRETPGRNPFQYREKRTYE